MFFAFLKHRIGNHHESRKYKYEIFKSNFTSFGNEENVNSISVDNFTLNLTNENLIFDFFIILQLIKYTKIEMLLPLNQKLLPHSKVSVLSSSLIQENQ